MRVDARGAGGTSISFRVTHNDLEQCVGLATAAFALEVLQGRQTGASTDPSTPPSTATKAQPEALGQSGSPLTGPLATRSIAPGVYFPPELPPASRTAILGRVKRDALVWDFEVEKRQVH